MSRELTDKPIQTVWQVISCGNDLTRCGTSFTREVNAGAVSFVEMLIVDSLHVEEEVLLTGYPSITPLKIAESLGASFGKITTYRHDPSF